MIKKNKYYKKIIQSNFGRSYGWDISLNDEIIAELNPFDLGVAFRNTYTLKILNKKYESILNEDWSNRDSFDFTYINKIFSECRLKNNDIIGPRLYDIVKNENVFEYRLLSFHPKFSNYFHKLLFNILLLFYK